MDEFSYFFSFFGLILGLTIAEVASKFADAIDAHGRRPIGILTPLLAAFVLCDISSFWLWTWSMRAMIHVGWGLVMGALLVSMAYFLSASLIFPRSEGEWASLDEHYWQRKRQVLAGITLANLAVLLVMLSRVVPAWTDTWAFFWMGIYFIPLASLWISRSKRVNIAILVVLLLQYQMIYAGLFPHSRWGNAIGLNGDSAKAATSAPAPPK